MRLLIFGDFFWTTASKIIDFAGISDLVKEGDVVYIPLRYWPMYLKPNCNPYPSKPEDCFWRATLGKWSVDKKYIAIKYSGDNSTEWVTMKWLKLWANTNADEYPERNFIIDRFKFMLYENDNDLVVVDEVPPPLVLENKTTKAVKVTGPPGLVPKKRGRGTRKISVVHTADDSDTGDEEGLVRIITIILRIIVSKNMIIKI